MTRNLKALGLALLAICALGAVAAQGASAATEMEFHSAVKNTAIVGSNVGTEKFAVGTAGTVECTTSEFEGTQAGTEVSSETYKSNTLTMIPHYTGCTFGGQPATVNFIHCAYVFFSDTPNLHAPVVIECSGGGRIEIDTSVCTITVGAQEVADAVRYENDTASSIKVISTAKNIVTGKEKTTASQTGCLLFPTGAIGTYTGESTASCFVAEGSALETTSTTTPTGLTSKGGAKNCKVQ